MNDEYSPEDIEKISKEVLMIEILARIQKKEELEDYGGFRWVNEYQRI